MARVGDGINTSRQQPGTVVEVIVPSHSWTEDSNCHYLLVDLPDFKKEQVKIQVINSGIIKVNGERRINDTKRIRFEQTYKVPPENTDTNTISAKFDGETQILYVTVPKQKAEVKKEHVETEIGGLTKDQQNANGMNEQEENMHKKTESEANEREVGGQGTSLSEEINNGRRWDCEPNYHYIRSAIEILAKNRRIVVTAILAFSLGMLVSHRFESNNE